MMSPKGCVRSRKDSVALYQYDSMILRPPDHLRQIEQPPDEAIHPVEDQHVDLVMALTQPPPELRSIERRCRAGAHVQVLGHADDLAAALLAQFSARLQLPLR